MKRVFLALAVTALAAAVSSCTKNEVTGHNDSRAISFVASVGKQSQSLSRGASVVAADLTSFGVFGYYGTTTEANFMNDQKVERTSSSAPWTYAPVKYIPDNETVDFYAYAPHSTALTAANGSIVATNNNGKPQLVFTVADACADQIDLLATLGAVQNDPQTGYINVPFSHILSRVGFTVTPASLDGGKTTITVNSYTLGGYNTLGKQGTYSFEDNSWSVSSGANFGDSDVAAAPGGYFFFIPQSVTGLTLTVNYTITTTDPNLPGRVYTRTTSSNISIPNIEWEQGKAYNYQATVTATEVVFNGIEIEEGWSETDDDVPAPVISVSPQGVIIPQTGTVSPSTYSFDISVVSGTAKSFTIEVPASSWFTGASGVSTSPNGPALKTLTIPGPIDPATPPTTIYVHHTGANSSADPRTVNIIVNGITVNVIQLGTSGGAGTRVSGDQSYVGAFWRASETGERLMNFRSAPAGAWTASVVWMDSRWSAGDIVFDAPGSLPSYPVSGDGEGAAWIAGTTATSVSGAGLVSGSLYFRIGLKSTYTATEEYPARYAVVAVTYQNNSNTQLLFLRQGEDPDYLFRKEDAYGAQTPTIPAGTGEGNWRPYASKFSPYNLTDPDKSAGGGLVSNHKQLLPLASSPTENRFTDYPSQAGALFQWAVPATHTNHHRRAYHPTNPTGNFATSNTNGAGGVGDNWYTGNINAAQYWTDLENNLSLLNETCPPSYVLSSGTLATFRRPNDGPTDGKIDNTAANNAASGYLYTTQLEQSEMRQSLYLNPNTSTSTTGTLANSVWGYYADGFFDRGEIGSSASSFANTAVSLNWTTAYVGRMFFNPTTNASLFFPAAGSRSSGGGSLYTAGRNGSYWSGSSNSTAGSWYLYVGSGTAYQLNDNRSYGFSVRCVRP